MGRSLLAVSDEQEVFHAAGAGVLSSCPSALSLALSLVDKAERRPCYGRASAAGADICRAGQDCGLVSRRIWGDGD
jgi:hypothetical protein